MKSVRASISGAAAAALLASSLFVAPALATPAAGTTPAPIVNGHFGTVDEKTAGEKTGHWGMILKTKDDTDVGSDQVTIQGGGYTGWHSHPAAVFITVTQGSIVWYDGSDPVCGAHTYTAGESFIESAGRVHNAKNASASSTAQFIAVRVNPTGVPFRIDERQPTNCGS
jgi:quercetin dioxygenase-like cupin family protein